VPHRGNGEEPVRSPPTLVCKEKLETYVRWRGETMDECPFTQMFIQ
jgi:hypothetical protein